MSSRCSRKLICLSAIGRGVNVRNVRICTFCNTIPPGLASSSIPGSREPRNIKFLSDFRVWEKSERDITVRSGEKFESDGNLVAFQIFDVYFLHARSKKLIAGLWSRSDSRYIAVLRFDSKFEISWEKSEWRFAGISSLYGKLLIRWWMNVFESRSLFEVLLQEEAVSVSFKIIKITTSLMNATSK